MPYQQLSRLEREAIAKFWYAGMSLSEIGDLLERNKGTISREIARNSHGHGTNRKYVGRKAHDQSVSRRRHAQQGRRRKLLSGRLKSYVRKKLSLEWSPEQISGRLGIDAREDSCCRISHVTIYSWLREDRSSGGAYWQHLRQSRRRRRKKHGSSQKNFVIHGKVSIEARPEIVDLRSRLGDWEGDLVQGKDSKSYLVTLVERSSGYLLFKRIGTKQSHVVRRVIIGLLQAIPRKYRKTLTFDNGTEFSEFKKIERALGISIYFAHPYASWERGTSENTNGLLRQYLPKGMDLRRKSTQELSEIGRRINNRPRKRLNYQTPREVLKA